ncbi:putative quinol monooxygenase [Parasphingorhabdus sp.]|uniref:putative quinol monooxygenase n=1 Tax=Parasphingorhabdus sp. TaxID=2709688 RepID=UPI002B26FD48|nr:antibiotic biosynthesis monooxygenase [Parasphingorhabdus sp.]
MNDSAAVHVLVEASPKEGEMQAVIAGFATSRERLKANRDCIRFDIYEHVGFPAKLLIMEIWASRAAHQREVADTMATPEFAAFREKLDEDIRFTYLLECKETV